MGLSSHRRLRRVNDLEYKLLANQHHHWTQLASSNQLGHNIHQAPVVEQLQSISTTHHTKTTVV